MWLFYFIKLKSSSIDVRLSTMRMKKLFDIESRQWRSGEQMGGEIYQLPTRQVFYTASEIFHAFVTTADTSQLILLHPEPSLK